MTSNLSQYEPSGRSECLCGSGKRFKNCCKNIYSDKKFNGTALFNKGEYRKALIATRAHITWYRLCHVAHTVPFLQSNTQESKDLLLVDIEALSDLIGLLLSCYQKCEILSDFLSTLDQMGSAIGDERWQLKIDYHRCAYLYFYKHDSNSTLHILKNYDWHGISDIDFLTFFLDIKSDILNQAEKISIAEKISRIAKSPSVKLQYTCLIGIQYCLLNDLEKGIPMLESAIEEYETIPFSERSLLGKHHLALAYKHLGELKNSNQHINVALNILLKETTTGEYSSYGLAQMWFDIADCYFHIGKPDEAKSSYLKSLSLNSSSLTEVFLARVFIAQEDFDEARKMLRDVKTKKFSDENYFDLAISKCRLAIKTKLLTDVDAGLLSIKSIKTNDPLFKDLVQDFLVQLYELRDNKADSEMVESALRKFNRYVSLKPNVFGFGIDINAILDDILP